MLSKGPPHIQSNLKANWILQDIIRKEVGKFSSLKNPLRGIEAALFIAPAGLLLIALAIAAWRSESGAFMWGAVIPATILGLMLAGTGIGITGRTASQITALEAGFTTDIVSMLQAELPRMQKVMTNFSITQPVFGVIALVGLLLRFGLQSDWAISSGSVLVAAGGIVLLIDCFAERRALPYVAALESLAIEQGISISNDE